ncbi:MAG: hypothetical protein K2L14_01050 [Duncaniella sp.]|nr:hypothetical protein [Duncaniella sp.]
MNISAEAIYWIFSTLPQVLAALAGLVMAGLTVYDQNMNRRIDDDPSLGTILWPQIDKVFEVGWNFFVSSILFILLDIGALAYADEISSQLATVTILWNTSGWVCLILFIVLILGNIWALFLLIPILNFALSEKGRNRIIKEETTETKRALEAEEQEGNEGGNTQQGEEVPADDQVSPMTFIEHFREFEQAVRAYFPDEGYFMFGKRTGVSFMVKQLCKENIIQKRYENELQNIIKLRNLYVHGAEIDNVSKKVIARLDEVSNILRERLPGYYEHTLGRKAEMWRKWINEYASDNKDKDNLIETVTTNVSHGKYHILINGYHVTVKPKLPDGAYGERLTVSHNDVQEFIRYLDMLRNE